MHLKAVRELLELIKGLLHGVDVLYLLYRDLERACILLQKDSAEHTKLSVTSDTLFQSPEEDRTPSAASSESAVDACTVTADGQQLETVNQHMERVIERAWKRILAQQLCWSCSKTKVRTRQTSVADPGSGAFLTPGSGIRDGY